MNIIIDDKIKLELLNKSHAKELFALTDKNRKYLRKWLPWVDSTQTIKDTMSFIRTSQKQYKNKTGLQFTIKYKNKLSGMVGLVYIDNNNKKTEIGYWLDSEFTGKGIMTKACKALIEHSYDNLNINRIVIRCAPENKASIGIPVRLNFGKEGILRDDIFLNGKFEDTILFAMLKKEWIEKNETDKIKIFGCHDNQAKYYDERVIKESKNKNNYIRENYFKVHREVLRLANLKRGENLLDIGIGTGLLEERIMKQINIFGIDISEKMMKKVKRKNLKVELKKGTFTDIPYEENMFDIIVSCFAFHHLTDVEKEESISEMKRVLKDKGRIVIGDFMYLNKDARNNLTEKFKKEKRNDMIEEMKDENFTDIDEFKSKLEENGFEVKYKQVSTISWVIKAFFR